MSLPTLHIVTCSTRPGRLGPAVAAWFAEFAREDGRFFIEPVDLAEVNLPLLDEPHHPVLANYEHEHTKAWSETVSRADAFVFVMPEYNYSFTGATKNALDFLHNEWKFKPIGFVSYGGVAAGTRAVQALKQVVTALSMMPVTESVNIPFFSRHIDAEGVFHAPEGLDASATGMLLSLARWADALARLRQPAS
jgi:NAD(P)H-dependent FMN reductase